MSTRPQPHMSREWWAAFERRVAEDPHTLPYQEPVRHEDVLDLPRIDQNEDEETPILYDENPDDEQTILDDEWDGYTLYPLF